ncbi:MAG: hypothetical protein V2I26_15595 [Halieaceae bacterium]|jgi:hypothetical protein|nr:hypothetical protein [Halieaceae bacterium]
MELLLLMLLTTLSLVALSFAALALHTAIERQKTQQLVAIRARAGGDRVTTTRQRR